MLKLRNLPSGRVGDTQDLEIWHCSTKKGGDFSGVGHLNAEVAEIPSRVFQRSENDVGRICGDEGCDPASIMCESDQKVFHSGAFDDSVGRIFVPNRYGQGGTSGPFQELRGAFDRRR